MQPPRSPGEFLDVLHRETAILQAQFPDLADALSRAHAILAEGRLWVEEDGRTAMVQSSDFQTWYFVNGHCPCPASMHRHEPCKHRLALRLYQRACDAMHVEAEAYALAHDPYEDQEPPQAPVIPPAHLVVIQGRPFIRFEGLLAMAHARSLVSLETTLVSVTLGQAVCQCTARFADGRTLTDVGDASAGNVAKHLRVHFIRMAATRASARALRRALNVSACSVEELGARAKRAPTPPP